MTSMWRRLACLRAARSAGLPSETFKNRNDRGHRLRLALEPENRLAVAREVRREYFGRHLAIEARARHAPHLAHPARRDGRGILYGPGIESICSAFIAGFPLCCRTSPG